MRVVIAAAGVLLIAIILIDAFETVVLPRRVTRRLRLSRLFMLTNWRAWSAVARRLPGASDWEGASQRDRALSVYGPLTLLLLLALWAGGLVVGFALLQWGIGSRLAPVGHVGFGTDLYMSGTTFFTLGLGDVVPGSTTARAATVAESATGFSFLALVIGYLPVIYGRFSERETEITLLDARAGSPPSAVELLRRLGPREPGAALDRYLLDWERWSADVLESHLSYPILAFFRSQHERQSWLATLTLILDACALVIVGVGDEHGAFPDRQARLTFAMARHAVCDLNQILNAPPLVNGADRLPSADLARLRAALTEASLPLRPGPATDRQLAALRALYEPYVAALADRASLALPAWFPDTTSPDDWETTAWQWDRADAVAALDGEGG